MEKDTTEVTDKVLRKRETNKRYRERTKDYQYERKRKWREANSKHIASLHKFWRENNKEKAKEARKNWRNSNPDRHKENIRKASRIRRARVKGAYCYPYSKQEVLNAYGSSCHLCQLPIDLNASRLIGSRGWENGLHIDHLVPIAKGGDDTLGNVRPAHGLCNVKKGVKEYDLSTTLMKEEHNDS